MRSCAAGSSVRIRAPHAVPGRGDGRDAPADRSPAAASARRCGRVQRRERAAAAPECSVPAIGCPGTKRGSASPSVARAAAITSCLVLPASVTIVLRAEMRRHRAKQRRILRDRRRRAARGRRRRARRSSRRRAGRRGRRCRGSRASSRFARPRPTPTTRADAPRGACSASANEPPIEADADDDELVDARRGGRHGSGTPSRRQPASAAASASRKRRFSAGSPTVTRSHSGSP